MTGRPGRLPEFPIDAFGPMLQEYCRAVAEATQTPAEMTAMMMLGALSTVSLGATVDAGGGWEEELGLYILVVMAAAERKSTVLRHVTRPLRDIERERREEQAEDLADAKLVVERLESRRRTLLQKYGRTDDDAERAETWRNLKDVDDEIRKFGPLHAYRLLVDDVTPEGLIARLSEHGRLGILAAEGSAIDNILGRYSEGKAKLDIVLKAYAGEPHIVDRRGRETEHVERPLLSISLAIQQPYLEGLIDHGQSRSLGLVSRFCFVIPRSRVGDRDTDPAPIDEFYEKGWSDTLRSIHNTLYKETSCQNAKTGGFGGSGSTPLNTVREPSISLSLDTHARARLRELQRDLEPRLAAGGDLAPLADWVGRHLGRVLRTAGILHLAAGRSVDASIDLDTFAQAEQIGDFLLAHGRSALEEPDSISLRAREVLERVPDDAITLRELRRQVFHGRPAKEEAQKLADELVDAGVLEPIVPTEPRPGRPSPTYKINRSQL